MELPRDVLQDLRIVLDSDGHDDVHILVNRYSECCGQKAGTGNEDQRVGLYG